MKRICLLGAAIAGLFIIGVTTAVASTPHTSLTAAVATKTKTKTKTTKVKGSKVSCKINLSLLVPSGAVTVTQGATDGNQAGSVSCGKPLGSGVQTLSFSSDAGGDLSGSWQQYFDTGTVYGVYALTPASSGPPTASSFATAGYTGTITLKAGAGVDKGDTGTGTLSCTTSDGVHYACTETLRLVLPTTKG